MAEGELGLAGSRMEILQDKVSTSAKQRTFRTQIQLDSLTKDSPVALTEGLRAAASFTGSSRPAGSVSLAKLFSKESKRSSAMTAETRGKIINDRNLHIVLFLNLERSC